MRGVPLITAVHVGLALGFGTIGQKKTHTAITFGQRDLFDLWKAKHNKVYSSQASEDDAFETWKEHHADIEAHNADPTNTYKRKHNHFSDHSNENHVKLHLGHKKTPIATGRRLLGGDIKMHKPDQRQLQTLPASWDWVEQGKVTPIKNQGDCGCCWAFAASAAIESAYAIENSVTPAVTSVSPQQFVSCANGVGILAGCDGGGAAGAFAYAGGGVNSGANIDGLGSPDGSGWDVSSWTVAGGSVVSASKICTCQQYPFMSGGLTNQIMCGHEYPSGASSQCATKSCQASTADSGTCDASVVGQCDSGAALSVSGMTFVHSEADLMSAVYQQPVAVAVNANGPNLMTYSSGVYDGCHSKDSDHEVLVVGWGTLDGVDYWKIKNSWNTNWGVDGYWLLKRGVEMCGIGYHQPGYYPSAVYPTGVTATANFPPPASPSPPPPRPPPLGTLPYGNPAASQCAPGTTNLNEDYHNDGFTYDPASSQYGNQIVPCAPKCHHHHCAPLQLPLNDNKATPAKGWCGISPYCVLSCSDASSCPQGAICQGASGDVEGTCVYPSSG